MSDTHTATHAAGSRGRTPASRLARLRISSLGAVIMLIIEFILGIIYNLYGTAPTADKSIGLFSSPVLALHVILAILLVIAAVGQLIRAIGTRHRLAIWMSAVGLLAILGRRLLRPRLHQQRRGRSVPRHVAGVRGVAGVLRHPGLRPGSSVGLVHYVR